MRGCAGWPEPLLFAYAAMAHFTWRGPVSYAGSRYRADEHPQKAICTQRRYRPSRANAQAESQLAVNLNLYIRPLLDRDNLHEMTKHRNMSLGENDPSFDSLIQFRLFFFFLQFKGLLAFDSLTVFSGFFFFFYSFSFRDYLTCGQNLFSRKKK